MPASLIEFRDPADMPTACEWRHPVDLIEPEHHDNGYDRCADALCDAMLYLVAGGINQVVIGSRAVALIHAIAPHRIPVLPLKFHKMSMDRDDSRAVFRDAGFLIEWLADASPARLSAFGMRALVLLYIVRADLIGGMTLAQIGALDGSTRQAVDKLVTSLRDTIGGAIRSRSMKTEFTRAKCKQSHLTHDRSSPNRIHN